MMPRFLACCFFVLLLMTGFANAAEWQWSVPVESVLSSETNAAPRAYLYIPPGCKRVRAVIVGQHNLLEEPLLESPRLRQTLADLDMAAVWVSPAFDGLFRFDKGAGQHFQGMMTALAQESGYSELQFAPIAPVGHSAMAGFPYAFAAWNPGRTLVAISIKGQWPDFRGTPDFDWDNSRLNNVPILYINGEYEDAAGRTLKTLAFKSKYPQVPLTMVADPGAGHFDMHDRLVDYIGLYLRKVAAYRLPATAPLDGPVTLKPIDPTTGGWLYDRWRLNEAPKAAPGPINGYNGDSREAFWAFDEELARATDAYTVQYRGKKPQLLGYAQNGVVLPQNPKAHHQVTIPGKPEADGLTFKISGTFIDAVPEGRPVGWTELPIGSPIGHAQGGGPVDLQVMTGPLVKTGPETFSLRFGRTGFNNNKRGGDVWFTAVHNGDDEYKRAVQQALLRIPVRNTNGADQSIEFADIPDQKLGTPSLPLMATSSAGVPVQFYVQEGPAEVAGNTLRLTAVPPRAKLPIKVTVVAWQWGRNFEPRLKTAEPVTRTFYLMKQPEAAKYVPATAEQESRARVWAAVNREVQEMMAPAQGAGPQNVESK